MLGPSFPSLFSFHFLFKIAILFSFEAKIYNEYKGVNKVVRRENIGIIEALIRITCGLTMLAWATAKMVKRPWRESYLFIALLSAMKVGEGIVRYCPIKDLYNRSQYLFEEDRTLQLNIDSD